jgi:hypothetical protein
MSIAEECLRAQEEFREGIRVVDIVEGDISPCEYEGFEYCDVVAMGVGGVMWRITYSDGSVLYEVERRGKADRMRGYMHMESGYFLDYGEGFKLLGERLAYFDSDNPPAHLYSGNLGVR